MNNVKQINRLTMRLLLACILFSLSAFTNSADGQTNDLEGSWRIDQIKVKKTVNNVSSEKTISTRQRIDLFADCPNKITFSADNKIIFEYNDKEPSEGSYIIEGNKVIRMISTANIEYEFIKTEPNKIQFLYYIDYFHNHEDKQMDEIREECTFYGTKE